MKTGILVIAQKAYQLSPGSDFISVPLGCPAVHHEIVATLADAVALKVRLLSENSGISVYGLVPKYLRSPKGYKANAHMVRGDNVEMKAA